MKIASTLMYPLGSDTLILPVKKFRDYTSYDRTHEDKLIKRAAGEG
jgi:hypothetical protein